MDRVSRQPPHRNSRIPGSDVGTDGRVRAERGCNLRLLADAPGRRCRRGRGTLLAAILAARTHLHGVVFDLPGVVAGAPETFRAAGVAERCAIDSGDFFVAVPSDGDGYLLANVLHDWDDERSAVILRNCRRAMRADGKVLIVERMIFDDPEKSIPTLLSDLNMLVLTGGQERTEEEYARLFVSAGLRLTGVVPVAHPYGIFEGAPN
jgi:hypothetical protein